MKLVEVTWLDPTIEAGWSDSPNEPLSEIKSYGILISRGKQVCIAGTYDKKHKKYADVTRFPKGCVIEIKEVFLE